MVSAVRSLLDYRELVYNLAIRDLRLKYKRSAIGIVWSLLNPLFMMIIYTVVFGYLLGVANTPGRPYWTLIMSGLLPWTFFSTAVGSSPVTFVHSSNLVSRLYFPIEALPIATVFASFVNFLIALGLLLVALLIIGMPLGISLILLPVVLLAQLIFTIGVSLVLATLTVYFRDLEHLVGIGMQALFYLTPVLYSLDRGILPSKGASKLIPYLKLNPLSWFMDSYHAVLYYGNWPDPKQFVLMLLVSMISLIGGYLIFIRLRARLPEEV